MVHIVHIILIYAHFISDVTSSRKLHFLIKRMYESKLAANGHNVASSCSFIIQVRSLDHFQIKRDHEIKVISVAHPSLANLRFVLDRKDTSCRCLP